MFFEAMESMETFPELVLIVQEIFHSKKKEMKSISYKLYPI